MPLPCVLIPAYQPDERLVTLVGDLMPMDFAAVAVVDDGSDADRAPLFARCEALGAQVLRHVSNHGKGRALKTGMEALLASGEGAYGVVTADADGQHAPEDIRKVAEALAANPAALVLGVRDFGKGTPLRSQLGNGITKVLFGLVNGSFVRDTQTGLRGIPGAFCRELLDLKGERYEFEMNMLLEAKPLGHPIVQVRIGTIYIEGNRSSHFDVLKDSVRIYRLLFAFAGSSLFATGIDYAVFALVHTLVPDVLIAAVAIARAASSLVNFAVNRHLVFRRRNHPKHAILRYYALVLGIMLASYLLISAFQAFTALGASPGGIYVAKLIADFGLYFVSYTLQRDFVYKHHPKNRGAEDENRA